MTYSRSDETHRVCHVFIVHYNCGELASSLIRRLPTRTRGGRLLRIKVIDNQSSRQSLELVETAVQGRDNASMVISSENVGFGEGVNTLARQTSVRNGDLIAILNPDIIMQDDCLDLLEAAMDTGQWDAVSPIIVTGDASAPKIWYAGGVLDAKRVRVRHSYDGVRLSEFRLSNPFPTDFCSGAALMVRPDAWSAVGGFPPEYFLYWEDVYFSWRASRLGLRLGVVPEGQVWHQVGGSSPSDSGISATFYYWVTLNRFRFASAAGVPSWSLILGCGAPETLRYMVRAVLDGRPSLTKLRAAARGTWRGLVLASRPADATGAAARR